ncbi:MAG: hypothetical protein N2321_02015 [Melioribacteraceae bacterium]|nr:hypothetical protein [Melioribacteraceae bacterium]
MKPHYKITIIYFTISFAWIFFSDKLVDSLSLSTDKLTLLQTYKGWFFVFVTSILLFYLIRKAQNDLIKEEEKKYLLFKTTMKGVHHILNNFLNRMNLFKEIANESNAVDKKTIELFDKVIFETAEELKKLSDIDNPTDEKIKKAIYNNTNADY